MLSFATRAAALVLALSFSSPSLPQPVDPTPTPGELKALVGASWPSFAAMIRQQEGLNVTPIELIDLPEALCRRDVSETYECVSLVEYALPSGVEQSSLLRLQVIRDNGGPLYQVIVIRELPYSSQLDR